MSRRSKELKTFLRDLLPRPIVDRLRRRSLLRTYGLVHVPPGCDARFHGKVVFGRNCRLGQSVHIRNSSFGDYTYVETDTRIAHAVVGSFTSIAPGAYVGLASHPIRGYASTHPVFYRNAPQLGYDFNDREHRGDDYATTTVGNDVWIGARALVRDGITIGDGAVVAGGAVVVKDVPPYAIVGGVPAKVIDYRFDEPTRDFLLNFRWWDRGEAWLREQADAMRDVVALRDRFEKDPVPLHEV